MKRKRNTPKNSRITSNKCWLALLGYSERCLHEKYITHLWMLTEGWTCLCCRLFLPWCALRYSIFHKNKKRKNQKWTNRTHTVDPESMQGNSCVFGEQKNLCGQTVIFIHVMNHFFQSGNFNSSSLLMQGLCYWNALSFTSLLSLFGSEKPIDKSYQHPATLSLRNVVLKVEFLQRTWSWLHNTLKVYPLQSGVGFKSPFNSFTCIHSTNA